MVLQKYSWHLLTFHFLSDKNNPDAKNETIDMPRQTLNTSRSHEGPDLPSGATFMPPEQDAGRWWQPLCAQLRQAGLHPSEEILPRRFIGGLANLNYLIELDGGWAVLRRPPEGPLPPGAHDMQREHRLLSRLWRATSFAPRSFYFCADASIIGAPFQIMEFRAGVAVRGNTLAPLPPGEATARRLAVMMVETLAALHAIDVSSIGLGDLGRPAGFFRRTASGWIKRCGAVLDGAIPSQGQAIIDWLEKEVVPDCPAPTLLHNDFKLDNILIDPTTLEPVAVLDWDMGTRGDPLFDVATLLSYWTEAGDPPCMHELAQMPTALVGFPSRREIAQAYAARTGRSLDQIKPYRVLTMFKLGVVFHQLHGRHRRGEPVGEHYSGFGRLADALFDFTTDIINDKIF